MILIQKCDFGSFDDGFGVSIIAIGPELGRGVNEWGAEDGLRGPQWWEGLQILEFLASKLFY